MNGKGAGGSGGCTALARLVEAKGNDLRCAALLVGKAAVRDGKLCDLREIARAGGRTGPNRATPNRAATPALPGLSICCC